DLDRHGLCDVGARDQPRSRLHRNVVPARANARRITPGLAGAHVEFPAVPGAADDLAGPGIAGIARSIRLHQPRLFAPQDAAGPPDSSKRVCLPYTRLPPGCGQRLLSAKSSPPRSNTPTARPFPCASLRVPGEMSATAATTCLAIRRAGRAPSRCRNRSCCGAL